VGGWSDRRKKNFGSRVKIRGMVNSKTPKSLQVKQVGGFGLWEGGGVDNTKKKAYSVSGGILRIEERGLQRVHKGAKRLVGETRPL